LNATVTFDRMRFPFATYRSFSATGLLALASVALPLRAEWTQVSSPTTAQLRAVNANNSGTPIAVGQTGTILTPDGATSIWTRRNSGTTQDLNGVWYGAFPGPELFVVVGDSGTILTGGSGITWTARTSGTQARLLAVTFGGGVFMAVGENGTVLTSTNGIDWTAQATGFSGPLASVAYGKGIFVIAGPHPTLLTTSDRGATFQRTTLDARATSPSFNAVAFGANRFYVTGANGTHTSVDGASWHAIAGALPAGSSVLGAAFLNQAALTGGIDEALLTVGSGGMIQDEWGNLLNVGAYATDWHAIAVGSFRAYAVGALGRIVMHTLPLRTPTLFNVEQLAADATGGAVDPSFRPAYTGRPDFVLPLPDGRFYLTGADLSFSIGGRVQRGIARLNANGSIDPSFNAGTGLALASLSARYFPFFGYFTGVSLIPQPGGRMVAYAGAYFGNRNSAFTYLAAGRFNPDGSPDPTFQPVSALADCQSLPIALADGRWLTAVPATDATGNRILRLARFTAEGQPDPSYPPRILASPTPAPVRPDATPDADPLNIGVRRTVDATGRIYLVTYYDFGIFVPSFGDLRGGVAGAKSLLFRLDGEGNPDASFTVRTLPGIDTLQATLPGLICRTTEGPVSNLTSTTFRLTFDGAVDPSFRADVEPETGANAYTTYLGISTVAALPDGSRYVLSGANRGHRGVVRFDASGDYDPDFALELGAAAGASTGLFALPDGNLLALGGFTQVGKWSLPYLARLIPDRRAAATR
jgi:uncharacterized delta-60 repeat protein